MFKAPLLLTETVLGGNGIDAHCKLYELIIVILDFTKREYKLNGLNFYVVVRQRMYVKNTPRGLRIRRC